VSTAFESCETSVDFSLRLFGYLRGNGFALGSQQTIACMQALTRLRAVKHAELLRLYRLTLVNRQEDLYRLQRLFATFLERYLDPLAPPQRGADGEAPPQALITQRQVHAAGEGGEAGEDGHTAGYSTAEVDSSVDFRLLEERNYPAVIAELARIARRYASLARRKTHVAKRGRHVDLRASLRGSVTTDGDIFNWRYRARERAHTRLTVVVDVSGSMEIYSMFLLNLLYLLHQNRSLKLEVFAFSTHLARLTPYLRARSFRAMLDNAARHYHGWAGGTRIGHALECLNRDWPLAVAKDTVVSIMSDGWDTGDITLLEREMARLASRARAVMWLNPLKGDPAYEPLALGMATARPYLDEFVSAHNLASLDAFAERLLG